MRRCVSCLAAALLALSAVCTAAADSTAYADFAPAADSAPAAMDSAAPNRDIITLGTYEQDNDPANGPETIEWIILEDDGENMLLLSKYALDYGVFDPWYYGDITWEVSDLRTWLNRTFFKDAFSLSEKGRIVNGTVTADENPQWSAHAGKDTADRVFILSIDEANEYFTDNESRKCVPTDYAVARGAGVTGVMAGGRATCWWWLRTPGSSNHYASLVLGTGSVGSSGRNVNFEYCVRPAVWVRK